MQKVWHFFEPQEVNFCGHSSNILGFIISKYDMIIDPERTDAIAKIGLLSSKKAMQSFLGKINFVRRFVPNFA